MSSWVIMPSRSALTYPHPATEQSQKELRSSIRRSSRATRVSSNGFVDDHVRASRSEGEAGDIVPEQQEANAGSERARRWSTRGRGKAWSRRAHSRDELKLAPALTLMSSSAARRQLCPADRSDDTLRPCAAFGMPTTPCRSTAARATSQNRPESLIFDVVAQGSEPSGRYPSPDFSFLEPSVERKSRRVGAVVVRAWAH